MVVVSHPWNDTMHAFSGILSHFVLFQQIEQILEQQETLVNTFVDKVCMAIDKSGLTGSGITKQHLQRLFDGFLWTLRQEIGSIKIGLPRAGGRSNCMETGTGYQ